MNKNINAEAFEAFLQKAFKMTAEDVAGLYNDAGELTDFSLIETKDAERIKKLSTDKTNQYNRGLKEGAQKLEKEIKEKYEVESELIGVELFDHVLSTKLEEVKGAAPEEVLKHPEVIKALNEKDKALRAKDKEWQKKLDEQVDQQKKAELFNSVKKSALIVFDNEKYILPQDARKAQALKDVFLNDLSKGNFQPDGDTFIVLKDNVNMKDEHGHPVTFDDYVKSIGEKYFDKQVAEDRSSSGNQQNAGQTQFRKPKDNDEYVKMMREAKTPEERIKIAESFGVLTKK